MSENTPEPDPSPPSELPPEAVAEVQRLVEAEYTRDLRSQLGAVPRPINWRTLPPDDLEHELLELNAWVNWLRHEYGLPAQMIRHFGIATPSFSGSSPHSGNIGCSVSTHSPKGTRPSPGIMTLRP